MSKANSTKRPSWFPEAVKRLDGDEGLLRELAAITATDLPEVIAETEMAIRDQDMQQAVSRLHKLKGMLSMYESGGVVEQIHDMFDLARKGKASLLRHEYEGNRAEIRELANAIASIASN